MCSDLANREQADRVLESMAARGLIELMERVTGERERRWRDLVSDSGGDGPAPASAAAVAPEAGPGAPDPVPAPAPTPARAALEARVAELEARVAALEERLRAPASGSGPAS
jgi:uncharacterized protein YceH (UPF0502 family)